MAILPNGHKTKRLKGNPQITGIFLSREQYDKVLCNLSQTPSEVGGVDKQREDPVPLSCPHKTFFKAESLALKHGSGPGPYS
jgi:hypothetical protein